MLKEFSRYSARVNLAIRNVVFLAGCLILKIGKYRALRGCVRVDEERRTPKSRLMVAVDWLKGGLLLPSIISRGSISDS